MIVVCVCVHMPALLLHSGGSAEDCLATPQLHTFQSPALCRLGATFLKDHVGTSVVSPLSEREAVAMIFDHIVYLFLNALGTHESSVLGGRGLGKNC